MALLTLTDAEVEAIATKVAEKLGAPPVSVPPPTPAPPPVVLPPPAAHISARWDALGSGRQWAKWNFITSDETSILATIYGSTAVAQHINWYGATHRLDGRMNKDGSYDYVDKYLGGMPVWVPDIGGAADARHKAGITGGVQEISPLG